MTRQIGDYWPRVLRELREFRVLGQVMQAETELLWAAVQNATDDQFTATATEHGLERRERLFNQRAKADMSLAQRRVALLGRYSEVLPYTLRSLRQALEALCGSEGYGIEVEPEAYYIRVLLRLSQRSAEAGVRGMLQRMAPANLVTVCTLCYIRNAQLTGQTHAQLAARTHYDIRNEAM